MHDSANQIIQRLQVDEKFLLGGKVKLVDNQHLAVAGAIDIIHPITYIDSAGAIAMTLANGEEGQIKIIRSHGTMTGTVTVTPTSFEDSTIAFTTTKQTWWGLFYGGKWLTLATFGSPTIS